MLDPRTPAQPLLNWLLIIGGAMVALAFYLGFVLLNSSANRRDEAEATTVALIATQIATQQPTPPTPTPFATVTPSPMPKPSSCAMVQQQNPTAEDGHYTIFLHGQTAVTLYCHDMANSPLDFITLPATADGSNFSLISFPEGAIITQYEKVRLDPGTLVVDATDMTFAVQVDSLAGYQSLTPEMLESYAVTASDFGVATGCNRGEEFVPLGRANIDLAGTPFILNPNIAFTALGFAVEEAISTVSENGETVNLTVNGRCGIMRPVGPIQLEYSPP